MFWHGQLLLDTSLKYCAYNWKKIDYVLIKTYNLYTHKAINVIVAKDLIGKVFKSNFVEVKSDEELIFDSIKNIPYLICESFKGKDILEVKYHQLWKMLLYQQITLKMHLELYLETLLLLMRVQV